MQKFNVTKLHQLAPPFIQNELNDFVKEQRLTLATFDGEFDNETKNRIYI
jgi:hypothetical protein